MKYGIIAGGEGSRLVEEGVQVPKPLVEIDGMPMIGRLIDIFYNCGAESIAVIVNENMTEVVDYLQKLSDLNKYPLVYSTACTPSSMHTLYELASLTGKDGKLIVTTVDTIFREEDFRHYADSYENSPAEVDALMAVTPFVDDEKPLYVEVGNDNRITAFLDSPVNTTKYVSGGIYGLSRRCIDVLEKCIKNDVKKMRNYQRALLSEGLDVRAYVIDKIIDVDHSSDIDTARKFIEK